MTEALFRDDAYLADCAATVTAVTRTDTGTTGRMRSAPCSTRSAAVSRGYRHADAGRRPPAGDPRYAQGRNPGTIQHWLGADAEPPAVGERVHLALDWTRRHPACACTALHLLSAVIPGRRHRRLGPSADKEPARLRSADQRLDKADIEARLTRTDRRRSRGRHALISDANSMRSQELVNAVSAAAARSAAKVRLVGIAGIDLQPAAARTSRAPGEIGRILVTKTRRNPRTTAA